jgi:hypothetical protein
MGAFSALLPKTLRDHDPVSDMAGFRSETFRMAESFPQIWWLNCRKGSDQRKGSDENRAFVSHLLDHGVFSAALQKRLR